MITRRGLLGMFAAGAGAAIITTPGLLMRVRPFRQSGMTHEQFERYLDRLINPPMLAFEPGELAPCDLRAGSINFVVNPRHGDTVTIGNTTHVFFDKRLIVDRNTLPMSRDHDGWHLPTWVNG